MNIGSMHSDEDDFYLPLWPTSSTTLSAPSFTSQSGNSGTIGLFNDQLITADSSFQTLDVPSLPMHSQYHTTAEVHNAEDFNFLRNVSELDPQLMMPELSDEYPSLWPEVPPTLRQYYVQEMPNENPQEIRPDFSFSTYTFPEENVEGWMGTEDQNNNNGATNYCLSNILEGNPARLMDGSENHAAGSSNQTGKTSVQLPDNHIHVDRRRGFRGFDNEKEAARAYDLAAIKLWGEAAPTNFSLSDYKKEMEEMKYMTKKEYLLSIRRNSDYKKWQARLGKGRGMRSIYIGTFDTEEEAARAYDVAAIRMKGLKAITNFELSNYDVKGILACEKLPIGKGASKVLKKTSVDDFLLKKTNAGNTPTLCLQLENPTSSQPNSLQQSFEEFNTLATALNNQISPYFHQNCNNANQVFHQNLSSPFDQLYATQELTQFGGGETSGGNMSESSNLAFPSCNGVWGEHSLTTTETNELMANSGILPSWNQPIQPSDHSQFHQSYEHNSQLLQPQTLSFPFLGYENPNFLTNPDYLHGSISAGSGLERNGIYMGGNLNGGFPGENGVLDGNSTVTNTGDYSLGISWGGIQQVEELDQTFQTLQQNQMFQFHQYAGNDINGQLQDQNHPDPSHSREIQNLESQTNPNNFLYGCLTGDDQMNVGTNVNLISSSVRGLAGGSWFPEESLMVMETAEKMNSNADHASNGGFRIHETPISMEGNSAPRSLVEKGDRQLSEDFGVDMGSDFGIDSFELDGSTFLDELISSF
ncbi:hypothetical protein I3760_09G033500 [Carya illinoinensis]|nr:hypothetical protein I3760_09G033500 [Carya illinoinensis]